MSERGPSSGAVGWTMFAGFVMILVGSMHAIWGLVAIINDAFYTSVSDYFLKFNVSTWGWIHVLAGIIFVLAGFAVFSGAVWARTIGVIMAMVSAIANFASLPYYPVWAILMIAIDFAVIWALTVHGRDITEMN
jgi:hypothetical protein